MCQACVAISLASTQCAESNILHGFTMKDFSLILGTYLVEEEVVVHG